MPTIERQVNVNAPPAKIYAQLTDFNSAAQWIHGMKECVQTTPGPFGVGTKARQLKIIRGKPTPVEVTVAEAQKDRMTKLVAVPKGQPPATVTWTLTPSGAGTLVHEKISFDLPGVMKLFTPLVKGAVGKEMDADTASLKRRAEAP